MKVEIIEREQIACAVCESTNLTVYYKLTNVPYPRVTNPTLAAKYLCHICANYIYSAIDDSLKNKRELKSK